MVNFPRVLNLNYPIIYDIITMDVKLAVEPRNNLMITRILTNERVLLTLLVIAAVVAAAIIAISVVGIRNPADAYATYVCMPLVNRFQNSSWALHPKNGAKYTTAKLAVRVKKSLGKNNSPVNNIPASHVGMFSY